jgi:hypothetical protein
MLNYVYEISEMGSGMKNVINFVANLKKKYPRGSANSASACDE